MRFSGLSGPEAHPKGHERETSCSGSPLPRDLRSKANRLGFSFGYVVNKSRKRKDGGRDLLELDLFEVSATPSPMNKPNQVLSTKSIEGRRYELPGWASRGL